MMKSYLGFTETQDKTLQRKARPSRTGLLYSPYYFRNRVFQVRCENLLADRTVTQHYISVWITKPLDKIELMKTSLSLCYLRFSVAITNVNEEEQKDNFFPDVTCCDKTPFVNILGTSKMLKKLKR